ncbi:hypothetical protein QJQ45_011062 [Haematococcus lacustris]|nr:hypothetical protein QJQ45_011062 [Haematococcus lacustris]
MSQGGGLRRRIINQEGELVDHDWVEDPANRGRLLRHAVHTTREMEAAMAAWQLDMVPWQQAELTNPGLLPRPPRPPTPYALTPTSKCQARHVFIDTMGLYGMMHDAGMLGVLTEEGVTSLKKFRNGALPDPVVPGHYIEGPKDSQPLTSFAQIVHTDGVAISVMFLRPKPAAPPAELPRMGRGLGAVNPLAHRHAEWLGVDPGKTNMATVAHEERSAAGTVVSVRHWKLTAGQYYRDSGITRQAQATKTWLAKVKPQLTALSRVSSKPSSLASYRRFADTVLATYDAMWAEVSKQRWANAKFRLYCGEMRVVASFWAKVKKQAQKRWPDRILALAYGAASFSGGGSVGCRGVPVSQMGKEAVKQFGAGRVVLVEEFRTSRVSSAYNSPSEALPGQTPESFRWLRPVYSAAKRSQVRGLMCSTSNNIRFYDRDVLGALNIRRCAVGPGPRPTELCYWDGRPALPKPGRPGQEWVYVRDKALLRKWRRKWAKSLRAKSLRAKSLRAKSLRAKSLRAKSLRAKSLRAKSLRAKSLRAKSLRAKSLRAKSLRAKSLRAKSLRAKSLRAKSLRAKSLRAKSLRAKSLRAKSLRAKSLRAKSLRAKSLRAKSLRAKSLRAKSLRAKSLRAKSLRAKSLRAKSLRAKSPAPLARCSRAGQIAKPPKANAKGKAAQLSPQPGRSQEHDSQMASARMVKADGRESLNLGHTLQGATGATGLEEEAASVSQQEWGTRKQLVVFFGNAGIGTRGGVKGKVVTVDEFRTSRVSSILNSPQPCEEELDSSRPTRPEDWKPKPGQVQDRLLRSAWSQRFEVPVWGLMWCPQLHQATPGDLGKWVDRDCKAALNLQPARESKWCPLELCRWLHRGRLPAQGKEYPALGFKKLRDRAPKAQAQQPAVTLAAVSQAGDATGSGFPYFDNCRSSLSETRFDVRLTSEAVNPVNGSVFCWTVYVKPATACLSPQRRCCSTSFAKVKLYTNQLCNRSFSVMQVTAPLINFNVTASVTQDNVCSAQSITNCVKFTQFGPIPQSGANGTTLCMRMRSAREGGVCHTLQQITNPVLANRSLFELGIYDRKVDNYDWQRICGPISTLIPAISSFDIIATLTPTLTLSPRATVAIPSPPPNSSVPSLARPAFPSPISKAPTATHTERSISTAPWSCTSSSCQASSTPSSTSI